MVKGIFYYPLRHGLDIAIKRVAHRIRPREVFNPSNLQYEECKFAYELKKSVFN